MSLLIDCLSICSLVGIWPRFIEPRRLSLTQLSWKLDSKNAHLDGLKIVHLSDLHFHAKLPSRFLKKITHQIHAIQPDLLLFSGDFICYALLEDKKRLAAFLNSFDAPLGCYCCFGNHDYAGYVSRNLEGVYDIRKPPNPVAGLMRGLKTLFSSSPCGMAVSERAKAIPLHKELGELLASSAFRPLENETVTLPIGLNLTGLGDLALGRCLPEKAFQHYQHSLPGIVLSHNPDTFPELQKFPGDWILSGHTHGEQIHLPWPKWGRRLTRKLTCLHHQQYTRGLFAEGDKTLYVNRGLGGHKPFRLFSPPEICLIQAKYEN